MNGRPVQASGTAVSTGMQPVRRPSGAGRTSVSWPTRPPGWTDHAEALMVAARRAVAMAEKCQAVATWQRTRLTLRPAITMVRMASDVTATRSRMMSGIRSRDTHPELLVRHALHAMGYRFRVSPRTVHGRPDLVLRKWGRWCSCTAASGTPIPAAPTSGSPRPVRPSGARSLTETRHGIRARLPGYRRPGGGWPLSGSAHCERTPTQRFGDWMSS